MKKILLVEKKIITQEQLDNALIRQKKSNLRIGEELIRNGILNEENMLSILAEDYQVNPGLHMSREDIKTRFANINDEQLDKILIALEKKGLAKLYRVRKGTIQLTKATYAGLRKANPREYYQWFPDWIDKEFIF